MFQRKCNTVQHNTIQHNTTQYNTTQYNTIQHNTTQHNTTQQNTTTNNNLLIIKYFLKYNPPGVSIAVKKNVKIQVLGKRKISS